MCVDPFFLICRCTMFGNRWTHDKEDIQDHCERLSRTQLLSTGCFLLSRPPSGQQSLRGRSRGAIQGVGTCIPCSWRRAESPSTSPPFLASPPVTRRAEEGPGIGDGRDTGAGRGWQGQTSPHSPEPPAGASAPRSRSRLSRAGCVSDEWAHLSSDSGDEFVCRSR